MKAWVKYLLVATLIFFSLIGLSMVVAYGIMSTHGNTRGQVTTVTPLVGEEQPRAHKENPLVSESGTNMSGGLQNLSP